MAPVIAAPALGLLLLLASADPALAAQKRASTGPAPASTEWVASVVSALPAKGVKDALPAFKTVLRRGPSGVATLASGLVEPGTGDDAGIRRALHGLAIHASRPGEAAAADRKAFISGAGKAMAGASGEPVRFLAQQVLLAAGGGSSAQAVSAVAPMLGDRETVVEAARIMATFGSGAAKPLRSALDGAEGRGRAAILLALGKLGDSKSVKALREEAASPDPLVKLAALDALAELGDASADPLLAAAASGSTGYEKWQATAARLRLASVLARGNAVKKKASAKILGELYEGASQPLDSHTRTEALVGLSAVKGLSALPLILQALKSDDQEVRAGAAIAAASVRGTEATRRIARECAKVSAGQKTGLLGILRDRGDSAGLPAVRSCLKDPDEPVRLAAIRALPAVGGARAVPDLARLLGEGNVQEIKAAKEALSGLSGAKAMDAVALAIKGASTDAKVELIGALASHMSVKHAETVKARARGEDEEVRVAALSALGILGDDRTVPDLIRLLCGAESDDERDAATKSLSQIGSRSVKGEAIVKKLVAAMGTASVPARGALLGVFPALGGNEALKAVRADLKHESEDVREAAVRSLSEWPDAAPAADLLAEAGSNASETHRVLALRGYNRLAGLWSDRPRADTVKMFAEGYAAAFRPDERRLVLASLAEVADASALAFSLERIPDKEVGEEAEATVAKLGRKLIWTDRYPAELALKKVVVEGRNEEARKSAREALEYSAKFTDFILTWQVSGPYSQKGNGPKELLGIPFDPEKTPQAGKWREAWIDEEEDRPNVINLTELNDWCDDCASYLRTEVWSPRDQEASLQMGSDDCLKAWVNGVQVHSNDALRGCKENEDKVKVSLKSGWNKVMLKVTNGGGDFSACARIVGTDGKSLAGLKYRAE
jgi:HEAT repeat protein